MIDDDIVYAPDEEEDIPIEERAREIAERIRGDTLWQYKAIEGWWNEGVFVDSCGLGARAFTPMALIEEQLKDIGEISSLRIMTPNIEYVPSLVNGGAESVTLIARDECVKTRNVISSEVFGLEAEYLVINPDSEATMSDKYDIAIGNPPYLGQQYLHQKFFNMAVNMVKNGGTVSFVQPATPYFNKKADTDIPSQKMRDNIKKYKTRVKIIDPAIFENVDILGNLAVTKLVKVEESDQRIERVEYTNGKVYHNVDLENVTRTQMEPQMFATIKAKYESFVKDKGSINSLVRRDKNALVARLPARVTDPRKWPIFFIEGTRGTSGAFGILASSKKEVDRIYEYLMTNPARFGLAINMFASDLAGGGHAIGASCGLQSAVDRRKSL